MTVKDTNPKDAIATNKIAFHLVPSTLTAYASLSFTEGAVKYGAYNWRAKGVKASVYKSAAQRHLEKWWNGEDTDPETGVPHLASVLACIGIIIDADECNKLTDDRPPAVDIGYLLNRTECVVEHLRDLHKDKNPHHYTIKDDVRYAEPRHESILSQTDAGSAPTKSHSARLENTEVQVAGLTIKTNKSSKGVT